MRFNVRENFVAKRKANFYPKKTKCSPNRAMKHIGAPIEVKGQIKVAPSNDAPEGFHRPASEIYQTYLHQTYEKNYNFAGTIFVDYENGRDFNDCNTLVYGHNMKNGSMFGHLKKFTEDEKLYNNDRYFWILTPDKNYRYEIISAYTTGVNSDTYTLFKGPGEEFEEYLKKIKSYSDIKTEDTELTIKDKIVTLSTCTGNESTRFVVQGKRVNAEDDGSGENAGSANSDAASVDSVTVQEG